MTTHNFSEAPASVTIRAYDSDGFDVMLTLRSDDTTDLLTRSGKALEWLKGHGYTPNRGQAATNGATNAPAADAPPVCPYHGKPMKMSKKPGSWFCPSKNAAGEYCPHTVES